MKQEPEAQSGSLMGVAGAQLFELQLGAELMN